MNSRQLFLESLKVGKREQKFLTEYMGFWPETYARWNEEGIKNKDFYEEFNLSSCKMIPINFNFVPAFETIIHEETDEYVIVTDETNCTKKEFKNSSAMPHYIKFPISKREDFEQIKKRMNPFSPERYPSNWDELIKEYRNRDYPLGLITRGPFAFCRDFIDFNEFMMLFYDDYEFVKEMMDFQTDFIIGLFDKALKEVEVDFIQIGEDMAYKTSTMISTDFINDLLIPCYRKLTEFFKSHGVKNIFLDSDGNIEEIIPQLIDAGITGILPVENAAGMDPLKLRKKYPNLTMIGGINKLNVVAGGEKLESEIEKAKKLLNSGNYIPSFDHSVPPILSAEDYREYIERLRRL